VSFYPSDEDKNAVLWTIFMVFTMALIMLLAGCGTEARCPDPAKHTEALDTFSDIGVTLAWAGGVSAAAGLAFSLISLFYPPLQPFAVLFRYAAIGGAGVSATGAAYIWIANHFWWVLAIAAVVGMAVGWYFWPRIHRMVDRRLSATGKKL
jgi:drug/metabolite transporter (DMT)-like permease